MKRVLLILCVLCFAIGNLLAQKTWIAGSGNWNTPASWSGGTVPVAGDDVVIPIGVTVTINSDAPVAGSLASLTVNGTLTTDNANRNVTIAGALTVVGTYDLSRSVIVVNGVTTISGTLNDANANGSNTFNGNIVNNGTINLSTTSATTLAGAIFTNNGACTIAGAATINSNVAISGTTAATFSNTFTIASGKTVTNSLSGVLTISGNLNGNADNTSKFINTGLLNYSGAAAPMVNGTFDATAINNTVNYNLNGAQAVAGGSYYNLSTSVGGTKTLQANVNVANNLTVTASILDFGATQKTLTVNGDLSANVIAMQGAGIAHVLNLNGANNAVTTFNTTAASGSSVNYGRNADQQVFASANYRFLQFTGSGNKTLQGNVTIANDLTINAGNALVFGATARTVSLTGNLLAASGAIDMTQNAAHILNLAGATNALATLTTDATSSTINYNVNGAQQVFASPNYKNLSILGGNIKTIQGDVTVAGTLTMNGSTLSFGSTPARTVVINGNLANSGGTTVMDMTGASHLLRLGGTNNALTTLTTDANASTVEYFAVGTQQVISSANYRNLFLSGSGNKTLLGNVSIANDLTINAGNTLAFGGTARIVSLLGNLQAASGVVDMTLAAHILNLAGATNALATLTTDATSSTISYNVNGAQQVFASPNYKNISILGGNIKTIQGDVTVAGTLTMNGSTLSFGSTPARTVVINGNLVSSGGTTVMDMTGASHLLRLGGASNALTTLTTDANASTVEYFAAGAQTVFASPNYRNLLLSGSGSKSPQGAITIANNLYVQGTSSASLATLSGNQTVTVNGSATIDTYGAYTVSAASTFNGNIINNGNLSPTGTTFLTGTTFTNNATSTLATLTVNPSLGQFEITGSSMVRFNNTVTIAADKTLLNTNTFGIDVTAAGAITGTNAGSIFENRTNLFYASGTTLMATGTLDADWVGNSIQYNRANTQTIKMATYHNLTVNGGAFAKTLQGNTVVNGNLSVAATTTLDLGTFATTFDILQNAQIDGTLLFNTTPTKTVSISGNLSGAGTINTSGGSLAHVLNLGGINNSINALITSTTSASIVNYNALFDQQIFSSPNYRILTVSGSGNKTMQGALTATDVNVNSGSLLLNGQTLTTTGNVTVASGAEMNVNASAKLLVANAKGITNNGVFRLVGAAGTPAILDRNGAGAGYTFTQNVGGTLHALYYQVNNSSNGLNILGGTIDNTDNLSEGSFTGGTGNQYINLTGLDLSSFANPVVNVVFNAGPTNNVVRSSGSGVITFTDASGAKAGENFDVDDANPGSLVNWTTPSTTFYSVADGVSAGLLTSWSRNPDGSGANPASVTDGTVTLIVQNGHTVVVDNQGDLNVLKLQVGQGTSGTLRIGQNTTQRSLTVQELLDVKAGATVQVASQGAPTHQVNIYGNFSNNGNFSLNTSAANIAAINFYATNLITGSVSPVLNEVNFKNGSSTTPYLPLTIKGNVYIENGGKFVDNGLTHTVVGNWKVDNTGVYTATGTIEFNGAINTLDNSGSLAIYTFNNLTFKGGGVGSILKPIIVNNDFVINNGTNVTSGLVSTVKHNLTVTSGASLNHTSTFTFDGTASQTIDLSGSCSFNVVTFNNGAAQAKSIIGNLVATGIVTISAGATIDGNGTHSLSNGMRIDGTCNWSGNVIFKGGTVSSSNATATLGTATVDVQGGVIISPVVAANSFTLNVNNDWAVSAGTASISNNAQLVGITGKKFSVVSALTLGGVNNFPTGFTTYDLSSTSTVNYNAAFNQTVRGGITYGNLSLAGASTTKTVDGAVDVNGNLSLNQVTFDLANYSHTFAGNIANANNSSIEGYSATVTLDADNAVQTIAASGTGMYKFGNLYVTLTNASASRIKTFSAGSTIKIDHDFVLTNTGGTDAIRLIVELTSNSIDGISDNCDKLTVNEYCQLNTAHPDFYTGVTNNFTTKNFDANSSVNYNLIGDQIVADGFSYGNLMFGNTGNKTARGALDINGSVSQAGGTPVFYDGGYIHTVAGDWFKAGNSANYYTITGATPSATGTIVFDGMNQAITGLNFNNVVFNNSGTASVLNDFTVKNNLTVKTAGRVDFSTRNLTIGGNLAIEGTGLFTQTTGTSTFNGAINQTITSNASSYLGNLTINKPNPAGAQAVTALSELHISSATTVKENAGVFDISNQNVYLSGNLTLYPNTIEADNPFKTTGSNVFFDGNSTQTIQNGNPDSLRFNNVKFSGAGAKQINNYYNNIIPGSAAVVVNGNFNNSGATINAINWSTDFYVKGNWANTGTFNHNKTVYFVGGNQTISSSQFYNVNIQGTDVKTLTGDITLSGSLTLANATLDANYQNITIAGNWDNSSPTAVFVPRTGKVIISGSNGSTITTGTITGPQAGKSFYNIEFNKSGTAASFLAGDLDVKNDFTIYTSSLTTNAYDLWVGGNFDNKASFSQNNIASTLTLNATGGSKIFNPNNATIQGFVVNATGTVYTTKSPFSIIGVDPQFLAGEFRLNSNTLTVNDNARKVIVNGGVLVVDSATVNFANNNQNLSLQSGELHVVGSVTKPSSLECAFNFFTYTQTGGTLFAKYYEVNNGMLTISGGTIDPSANLSYGKFSSLVGGTVAAPRSYINLDGYAFADFTVDKVSFNSSSPNVYNVNRPAGSGTVTFADASGSKAGETFDIDNGNPGTLVNWSFPEGFYWDGEAGTTSWHDASNWSSNLVPAITDIAYLNHKYVAGAYTVDVNADDAQALRVIMDAQASANGITLQLTADKDLTVAQQMQIGANTTFTQTNSTNLVSVGGDWSNAGTFNNGGSTVTLNAPLGTFLITTGGIGAGKAFANLTINTNALTTYSLGSALEATGNLTVSKGVFDLASGSNDIWVGGNWFIDQVNGGSFICSNADVTLNGTGNQSVTNGTFYNLFTSGGGIKNILSNIDVNNNLTIGALTSLAAAENTIYVGLNWINNGTFSQSGLGKVVFDGAGNQSIGGGSASTTFNHVIFQNGGWKTFFRDASFSGNFNVNSGAAVNLSTFIMDGGAVENTLTSNGTIELHGANNFPINFETIILTNTSNTSYNADITQHVYPTTYGSLSLRSTNAVPSMKIADGNLNITGSLNMNSGTTTSFDVASKQSYIKLTGTININTGNDIIWGTGNSTLEHVGGDWWGISANLDSVNNLILAGTGSKYMFGNLLVGGNVTVKTNISLLMYSSWNNQATSHTMKGLSGKSFTLESGARVYNTTPTTTGVAFAEGFGTYNLDANSYTCLNSLDTYNQTIYTGSNIVYGNLTFNNIKTVTSDGQNDLLVKGDWDINVSTYIDAGKNCKVGGANIYITNFTPSAGTSFFLNGSRDQNLRNNRGTSLNFINLYSQGTGVKILGDVDDIIQISGNNTINSTVSLVSSRNITFTGTNWTNNGLFRHTANTLYVSGAADQTIYAGATSANNNFSNITFDNTSTKTFITNGADIRGSVTINAGTVNLGALAHKISGNITNILGGTLQSASADINFNGGNQNINTPSFAVNNVNITGTGTKRLFSDWTINGNLVINVGTALNTSDAVAPTISNIYIKGNWTNNGTFTANTSLVTFNGISIAPVSITSGGSNFYDVNFAPLLPTNYNLLSTSTRISHSATIGSAATLNLLSQKLILGSNIASGKLFTVNGTLNVNANASLLFNNQTSQSVLNVNSGGRLRIVGNDMSNVALLSREVAGVAGAETQINVVAGGNIEARYYLIEYMQDAGMNLALGSKLDAVNNFSDGVWSNIRNANGVRYLTLESDYTGANINNITFNYAGAPTAGTRFNVKRELASTNINFGLVYGNLGTYLYEDDDEALAAAGTGKLRWSPLTATNWTGNVNTDWHIAGNWDNGVPTLAMDAFITDRTNDPIISNADAVCKNLTIQGSGQLLLDNNKNLQTGGDVTIGTTTAGIFKVNTATSLITVGGMWTKSLSSSFVHGNGTVLFNSGAGSATISPSNSDFYNVIFNNPSTIFYLSGSPINVKGRFEVLSGEVIPTTNNYIYNIEGDFLNNGGVFTPISGSVTAGVVRLTGVNQTIKEGVFSNIEVAGAVAGVKTFTGATVVNGTTLVNSVMKANTDCNFSLKGNVTIDASGGFIDGGQNHSFTGQDWRGNGSYSGTGSISFDRTVGDQNVYKSSFNTLIANCTGRNLNIQDLIKIATDFSIKAGSYSVNSQLNLISNTTGAGTLSMEANTRLIINGHQNFPKGFGLYSMDPKSTVSYQGSGDQDVDGVDYGNLNLANNTIKTLKGDINVLGSLNFGTASLDVSNNNYSIYLAGDWNNNGGGNFVCHQGEVVFNGSGNQAISYTGTSVNNFYEVTVDKSAGYAYANQNTVNDFKILNNLTVKSGQFNANGRTIYIGGNLMVLDPGTLVIGTGHYYLNKVSGTATIQTNSSQLNQFTINSSGGCVYTLLDDLTVLNNVLVEKGTLDGNGKTLTFGDYYSDVCSINGTLKLGAGGILALGNATSFTVGATGTLEVVGSSSSVARVTRNATGGVYNFTVDGKIKARNYLFEYMSNTGVFLSSTSTIDATDNFSYGTFTNGTNNGPMLRIENNQSFVSPNDIKNVAFPANPGGSSFNVAKPASSTSIVEFYNASGVFAGENSDNDPADLVHWTGPLTLTWNGSVSSEWKMASNWTASYGPPIVPTGNENVIIATATNQPVISTFGALTDNLTINQNAVLTLNTPADAGATDLEVKGAIQINGTFQALTVNDNIQVDGNWTKSTTGLTSLGGSTVTFNGTGGSKTINNGNSAFNSVVFGGTSLYQIAAATTLSGDLTINSGATFSVSPSNYDLTVKGNWLNNGTFLANSGKVIFASTSSSCSVNNGSSKFFDVDINSASATYSLTANTTTVFRNLNIISGTLDLNGKALRVGDGLGIDNLSVTGRLDVDNNAVLQMANNTRIQVNSGGTFNLLGTDNSNRAIITGYSGGRYAIDVNSGANFAAKFYTVEYTDVNGLYLHSGAVVDPLQNLSDGIFSFGYPASGAYLKLENELAATDTIKNVTFNNGALYNAVRTNGTTVFYFQDATGTLGSYEYESDNGVPDPASGYLQWMQKDSYLWTGAVDSDWHKTGNWSSGLVPDLTKSAVIPAVVPNYPNISTAVANVKTLTVKPGASITISRDLTVAEDFFYEGAVTAVGSPNITVSGNWSSIAGSFTPASSSVILNASSGTYNVLIGTGSFYNLQINSPLPSSLVVYKQGSSFTVANNFNLTSGTFNLNNFDLNVGGDMIANGTLVMGTKTLTLNGTAGSHVLNTGSNVINKLTINSSTGAASWLAQSNIIVTNDFTITKGIVDLSPDAGATSYNLTIGKSYNNNGGLLIGRNATIKVGENWKAAGSAVFNAGNSIVDFVSDVETPKRFINARNSALYNVVISGSSSYRLSDNLTVANNLTMNAGSLDLASAPSYNLTLNGNWVLNASFTPNNGRVILNGTTQSITASSDVSFYQLTNNASLTTNVNLSVQDNLVLNGSINVQTKQLTLGASLAYPGTLTYTSGLVLGKFERWITAPETDYVFPVGIVGNPHLATFRAISNLTPGSLLVEYKATDPGNAGLPLTDAGVTVAAQFTEGYWKTLAKNGLASTDYNMSVDATGFTSHALYGNTRLLKRNNAGNWGAQGTHVIMAANIAKRTGFNGISTTDFCLGSVSCLGGTVGSDQGICEGNIVDPFTNTISPAGGSSYSYQWLSTTTKTAVAGDANWTSISGASALTYNHAATVTDTVLFVRKAASVGCPDTYSNIITIKLYLRPKPVSIYRKIN